MKCECADRTLTITEIPDHVEGDRKFEAPPRMVITLTYEGPSNVWQGIAIDNTIIPMIKKALNTTKE